MNRLNGNKVHLKRKLAAEEKNIVAKTNNNKNIKGQETLRMNKSKKYLIELSQDCFLSMILSFCAIWSRT